ncbi:MAG: TonB-dependent receptor [Gemmatimonadota bacterium]
MRSYLVAACASAAFSFVAVPEPTAGQDPAGRDSVQIYVLDPLTVDGRIDDLTGTVPSASVGYVGRADLRVRPLLREGELLETVPGMILTQHSGGGKSNQMFVRGFNLDHGTDFSTRLEGIPVNFPTHAHGHGYTDLNVLIPELVDHIEYALGSYYAEIGDFSAAGGAHIRLRRSLDRPLFDLGVGENGHRRAVAAASTPLGVRGALLVGGELRSNDGPWDVPEDLHKASGMARYTYAGRTHAFSILALGYDNSWQASDQVPERAVASGALSRFGTVDTTLGGETYRYALAAAWSRATGSSSQRVEAYVQHYGLDLFGNFTYALEDPANGDQVRQEDDGRWTLGARVAHLQPVALAGGRHRVTVGAELRQDVADLTLSRTSARQLVSMVRHDDVTQRSAGVYAELESPWSGAFRTTLGVRGDAYHFDVASDRPENTGTVSDQIVSPKLSLAFGPWSGTELYLSAGLGFHSNDARGAVTTLDPVTGDPTEPVDPLVRSRGAEVGVRSTPVARLRSTLALWTVELDSELLFVGDAGSTEASDPSRRLGVTLANFYRFSGGWTADIDVSLTRARLQDVTPGEDRIPGALENVIAAGVSYESVADGPFGAVRLRRFGTYPLIEDNSRRAAASSLVNLSLGYRLGSASLSVSVLNVLDAEHSDIQYFYESRLTGEPGPVEDVHFHPAEPREFRVAVSWGL